MVYSVYDEEVLWQVLVTCHVRYGSALGEKCGYGFSVEPYVSIPVSTYCLPFMWGLVQWLQHFRHLPLILMRFVPLSHVY